VTITVDGSYFNVERFFAAVEKLPRAVLVPGWTIGPQDANGASSSDGAAATPDGTLTATLTASVFESPVTTVPPAAASSATTTTAQK
jgi:hypothetical protein